MEDNTVEINLKDYYYWYITDEFIEVSDEVAAALCAGKRYESVYRRRMKRNYEVQHDHTSVDAPATVYHVLCRTQRAGRYWTHDYDRRAARGKLAGSWRAGTTGEDVFHWWMQDRNIVGQMKIEGFDE